MKDIKPEAIINGTPLAELIITDIDYYELKELIACQTMLDMIIATKNSEREYYVSEVIKAAENLRQTQYLKSVTLHEGSKDE